MAHTRICWSSLRLKLLGQEGALEIYFSLIISQIRRGGQEINDLLKFTKLIKPAYLEYGSSIRSWKLTSPYHLPKTCIYGQFWNPCFLRGKQKKENYNFLFQIWTWEVKRYYMSYPGGEREYPSKCRNGLALDAKWNETEHQIFAAIWRLFTIINYGSYWFCVPKATPFLLFH